MLQIENDDVTEINMIAFRRVNQVDLSGNVVTNHEYLPHLKVSFTYTHSF
jgi:hypothetical protein